MERISVEKAEELLCSNCTPIFETECISLWDALGRVLAEEVKAEMDQPPFPRSPLDGYALRSEDTFGASRNEPVKLRVIEEVIAGNVAKGKINNKEAIRIMTGAPIPTGADCIIRQEDTDYGMQYVNIYREIKSFDNYCYQGEDFKNGQILLFEGTVISSIEIGILASCGKAEVLVYKNPEITLITTGNEITMPGMPLAEGKIYNSNLFTLRSRLKELGVETKCHMQVEDDVEKMASLIQKSSRKSKLIITTGGVSVGKMDIMHDVFEKIGVERLFWKVAIKPGTPTLCGKYNDALIICLSGNPFGAMTNFELLVRPVLAKILRKRELAPKRVEMVMGLDYNKGSKVTRYVRAACHGGIAEIPDGKHSSGVLSSMVGCNCLIEIPKGDAGVRKGEKVWVITL